MHGIHHLAFRGLVFGLIVVTLWLPDLGVAMIAAGFRHLLSQDGSQPAPAGVPPSRQESTVSKLSPQEPVRATAIPYEQLCFRIDCQPPR